MFIPKAQNPALAALLILVATAFIAATTLLAKSLGTDTLGPPLHAMQISHGRFIFAFCVFSSVMLVLRPRIVRPNWALQFGRSFFGWMGATLMFASAAFIPLSDATAISFLSPVWAMLLSIPLLGERVGPVRWSAAAIALLGAMILIRPSPGTFQAAALLPLALSGSSVRSSTDRGTLKLAMFSRHQAMSASASMSAPGRGTTNARPTSPRRSSGMPTTATWLIEGWFIMIFSISAG